MATRLHPIANGKPERLTWRERFAAMRYVPALLELVWQTDRLLTFATGVLRLIRAFVPVATLWIGKLIIDEVIRARGAGPNWRRLGLLVGIELAIAVGSDALGRASQLVEGLLGDLFTNRMSIRLMEHAATLDLAQFEDPEFYDHLERARRNTTGRIGLLAQVLTLAQDALTLITLSAALLAFSVWLFVLLVLATLPAFVGEAHFASLQYSLLFRRTPERRQLDYLRYVGASNETAKEVQIFGLAPWLIERYRVLSDLFYDENKILSYKRAGVGALLSLVGTGGYYAAYVLMLVRAVLGAISVGTLTFLAGSFQRGRSSIQSLLLGVSSVAEQALYLKDLFTFFEMKPTITARPGAPPVPRPIREGFVFEDVGFSYPGSDRWAVRHVDLSLRPGERVALVGLNGAGKTTLVKLLSRLYDPTEGRILLDGRDLREYDLASVRQAVGVIFQDFVRYDMRFDENIAVGEIDSAREYLDSAPREEDASVEPHPAVASAAERSLAASLLPRLPARYRQMLGRRFEQGVDLSGGEWQKVALARAYMRDAQLLILDEPTAALDARAEYEVFLRFAELIGGRMAILISHRFSTVRMADRIVVLQNGAVTEQGSHEELLQKGGLYAELFDMQAAGYR
ncbi:MAG TPA: ABC transporter ATP-binding protein [Gemmatimonadaceae bacterium]|nr:ABC transporter ATP-binding protein [Gemmatimonadaceae bacterium]